MGIGAMGSLHCASMCGGIVVASAKNSRDTFLYNIGRLFGYQLLALTFSLVGTYFVTPDFKRTLAFASGLFMAIFFLVMSVYAWRGRELSFHLSFIEKLYSLVFRNSLKLKTSKSFMIGFASILLPCALSYSVIFASLSLSRPWYSLLVVASFWLATLPAMTVGPALVRRLIGNSKFYAQKIMAVLFFLVAMAAIVARVQNVYHEDLMCF